MKSTQLFFITFIFLMSADTYADDQWRTFSIDNDLFVGNDSGYSNGLYYSWIDPETGESNKKPSSYLLQPLLWSIGGETHLASLSTSTIGQAINTPQDITIENPDERELPYSGLLFFNSSYISIKRNYADKIGTTIGIIGPSSGAEFAQKSVHQITGSDEPKGWDTQLKDELVFQFTRARTWRSWVSNRQNFDLLFSAEANIGTISSSVSSGATLRYGRKLIQSYATQLFDSSRISSPVAVNGGWYIYAGLKTSYVFNQIFADGNTYRDSRSIDYDPESVGLSLGYSYSWENLSVTFAINDSSIIENKSEEQLEDLTRYGTLTFAWRQ